MKYNPKRISKLKPHANNQNWKDINFPAGIKDWQKFKRNNKNITLNILSVPYNKEKISLIYKSNCNRKRKNQVILLMITNNKENWHYPAVKNLSGLFRGITSNNNGDFYCLNCIPSYLTDNALKEHERLCNNHDHCEIIMPEKNKNIKIQQRRKIIKSTTCNLR